MTHQWLVAESNDIDVSFTKVGPVRKQGGKQTIAPLGRETKHKSPVEEPLSLVQHLHGQLAVSAAQDVLELSDRGQLGALATLLVLDLAGKESPEDLGDELRMLICRVYQDLLQVE